MPIRPCLDTNDKRSGYLVDCPGCDAHYIRTVPEDGQPVWTFNGNMDKPTFSPSVRSRWDYDQETKQFKQVCHFFLIDGIFEFCSDCTHELAGQKVPMPE